MSQNSIEKSVYIYKTLRVNVKAMQSFDGELKISIKTSYWMVCLCNLVYQVNELENLIKIVIKILMHLIWINWQLDMLVSNLKIECFLLLITLIKQVAGYLKKYSSHFALYSDIFATYTCENVQYKYLNTLRPGQNWRHFADNIFKCIFLNENVWIPTKISLKFVPKGPINNIPALVQIMAWRRTGDKPLSEPMMVRLPMHICLTQPQWVNTCWIFNW